MTWDLQWLIASALSAILITHSNTFLKRIRTVVIYGALTVITVFFAGLFCFNVYLSAVFAGFITFIVMYVKERYPGYFFPAICLNLLVLLSCLSLSSIQENLFRSLYIIYGLLIALAVQVVLSVFHFWNLIYKSEIAVLNKLRRLNTEIFACLLQAEYSEAIYLFEKRLHEAKKNYLLSIATLRKLNKSTDKHPSHSIHAFENLYLNFLDCAQLRRRITDHTTLSLCHAELSEVVFYINAILLKLAAMVWPEPLQYHIQESNQVEKLAEAIQRLEENYTTVLQVAAREPLAFHLFIASLKTLQQQFKSLQDYEYKYEK